MIDVTIRAIDNFFRYINSPEVVESIFSNRFYTILAVVMLMRIKYATYSSMFVCALVNIPASEITSISTSSLLSPNFFNPFSIAASTLEALN